MKFLLIDDDAAERSLTIAVLSDKFADVGIVEIDSCAAYVEKIDDAGFDLAIIDYRFSWTDGLTLFKAIRARYVGLPVIMLTGAGNEEIAVTAIKSGIADYIVKRNRHLLSGAVERSLLEAKERECRKEDNQFRLYERRDPFISRFTRDYAYFIRISPDGRPVFEWVSEQLKQLIDSAGAQAQDWILPVHPEDVGIVQDRFKRLLTGVEDTSEYRIVINEEDTRYFSDHSIPVRDLIDGKVIQLYGVMQDITARKKAEDALRDLSGYLEAAREDERTRIAREIHDELGSLLTALKMDLSWLNKQLPEELVLCHGKIQVMIRHLDDGIQTVRRIIADLRPSILDHLGLLAAIEWKLDEFKEQSGIQYELTMPENNIVMDENRDIAVFRIMQEALSNVVVHSGASKVTLVVATDVNNLTMKITDNGCGMTKAQMHKPGKYGILGMHERARHFGGEVTITSHPGKGTTLELTMHLQSNEGESRHD